MEQSKAMEYESRKASSDVLKLRNVYINLFFTSDVFVGNVRFLCDYMSCFLASLQRPITLLLVQCIQ